VLRPGDPLGLGIDPANRPPAPPDPDTYDRARENAEFARSILSEDARRAADEDTAKGFMSIAEVRAIVSENTIKGETISLDPDIMMLLDARINYKIFVASDNVYTREELYAAFPFHELNVQPEAIFAQQEIGVFPARKYALKEDELEYIARDVGDASVEFVMIEDLVGQVAREGYKSKRAPLKIAKTKIYIGKEQWDDFSTMQRVLRGLVRVTHAQIAYSGGGGGAAVPLLGLLGGQPAQQTPLLVDRETFEAEKQEYARREAELQRREEEQRRREEEQRKTAEETQRRIDADLRRVEEMLAAVTQMKSGAAKPAPRPASSVPDPSGPASAQGADDDSVAI
jgi:hypothetical protein